MNSNYVSVLLFVLAAALVSVGAGPTMKCKGVDYEIKEEQMMDVKECFEKLQIKSMKDVTPGNAGCLSKCIMTNKGLIDAAGKPHKENIMTMIDSHAPASIKDEFKAALEKCLDNEGSKVDANEASCNSFLPLSMCAHMAMLNICQS